MIEIDNIIHVVKEYIKKHGTNYPLTLGNLLLILKKASEEKEDELPDGEDTW